MKIEIGKQYQTQCGCPAQIYSIYGREPFVVHGEFFQDDVWRMASWTINGKFWNGGRGDTLNLVEIPSPSSGMIVGLEKKYVTVGGEQVRIDHIDGAGPFSVHGAIRRADGWYVISWTPDGRRGDDIHDKYDNLMEISPDSSFWYHEFRSGKGSEPFHSRHNAIIHINPKSNVIGLLHLRRHNGVWTIEHEKLTEIM